LSSIRSRLFETVLVGRKIGSKNKYYAVVSGDICYAIATRFNITVDELLKWNPIVNSGCSNLYVGQFLHTSAPALDDPVVTTEAQETTITEEPTAPEVDSYRFVCYYPNWSSLKPASIDPTLCTHIIYAFATIKSNKLSPESESNLDGYKELVSLRDANPKLKILISCKGFSLPITLDLITSKSKQAQFVSSTVQFLEENGLDGLDLDWVSFFLFHLPF
jgi:GH18 family chitinase